MRRSVSGRASMETFTGLPSSSMAFDFLDADACQIAVFGLDEGAWRLDLEGVVIARFNGLPSRCCA